MVNKAIQFDKENGNILGVATWNVPVKNASGNIFYKNSWDCAENDYVYLR